MANQLGLVSISFRKCTPSEIVKAVRESGLTAIEWGGDVHVPHGDIQIAEQVKNLSDGLFLPEYGSYYTIGDSAPMLFDAVLTSARILGTKRIRVWPGRSKASDSFTTDEYAAYVADARRICDEASDMELVLECHPHSLTDEYHTALRFLRDVDRDNLKMLWQPNQFRDLSYNLDALHMLKDFITSVHVFSWDREKHYPLAWGAESWAKYLEILRERERSYLLEFIHDNRLESLPETAQTLATWLK